MAYRTVTVDVDVSDVLEELEDEDIIAQVRARKLRKEDVFPTSSVSTQPYVMDYFELAHEALLQGRSADAIALLERGLFPSGAEKTNDGALKYRHAMA